MKRINHLRLFAVTSAVFIAGGSVWGMGWELTPGAGASAPMGAFAERWQTGYSVELTAFRTEPAPVRWGARAAFRRWEPAIDRMLELNGREYKVHEYSGWNTLSEASLLARLAAAEWRFLKAWGEAGVGVGYQSKSSVRVAGYYPYGRSVVNRVINHPGGNQWGGVFSLGIGADLFKRLSPSVNYQYAMMDDEAQMITFTIGLMPK